MVCVWLAFQETYKLFSDAVVPFYIPAAVCEGSGSHSHRQWFSFTHSNTQQYLMVLICISPVTNDGEHLFMYLFSIHISSLVKSLFKYFPQFFYWVVFLLLIFGSSSNIWIQVLYFLQVSALFSFCFIFLRKRAQVFNFTEVPFISLLLHNCKIIDLKQRKLSGLECLIIQHLCQAYYVPGAAWPQGEKSARHDAWLHRAQCTVGEVKAVPD